MGKAFSPLSLGVGVTALLALMPGLGFGSGDVKPKPAVRATARSKETKALGKSDTLAALLEQCLKDSPRPAGSTLDVSILTLPDPQRTSMAFWFDLRLNAVQRAFTASGFLARAFFLPWEAEAGPSPAEGISSEFADASPGLIWFARDGAAPAYHALFIVGESQTLGLNRKAFREAFRLASHLPRTEGRPVAVLGPQFSGTLSSLGAALADQLKAPGAFPVGIQGTTTLSPSGIETLKRAAGTGESSLLQVSDWTCNLSGESKDRLLIWYGNEAGWPYTDIQSGTPSIPSYMAIFTEANTAYDPKAAGITRIPFPMGLSRLRLERRAMEQSLGKGEAAGLVLPSTLLGRAEDDAARVRDTPPQYSADTVRNAELTLAGTILSLARRGYTHIGISASDPEDLIFLAERIRAYHPGCTLFTTSGNHLLYAHPNISHALDGMVMVGGYPLTDTMRAVSLLPGSLTSTERFTSEGEYACYYAALARLDPAWLQPEEARHEPTLMETEGARLWGKQGFVSIVKGGSIWPLRHGGVEEVKVNKTIRNHEVVEQKGEVMAWNHKVEDAYRKVAAGSVELTRYAYTRLPQLTVLLLFLGLAIWLVFLRPLLELPRRPLAERELWPHWNLVAGAALSLALVSLLAVGYLAPLAVLEGDHWKRAFLWSGVALWVTQVAFTGRAFHRRMGWPLALPLLLLALVPAAALGLWAKANYLQFVPAYLRFTSPGRGVSLLPTMVLLAGGLSLLLRTWYDVGRQNHEAFWPVPFGVDLANGLRHLRGLAFQPWLGALSLVLVVLQILLPGGILHPLMESRFFTLLVLAAGGNLFLASLFLMGRLHLGWRELRQLLDDLNLGPYRAAFKEAGRLMNWNAMRALGRGLKVHRSSRRGRELLLAQAGWAACAVPAFGTCLQEVEVLEAKAIEDGDSRSEFGKWRFRQEVARYMTACGDALEAACAKDPQSAALHQGEIDLFRALRAIHLIREAFLVVRHLLMGALGSMLLLVLGVAAFDFQPKGELLMVLGALLLAMAAWIAWAILQVERDPLLCLMEEEATPGEVNWSMGLVENGLRFVLLPLVLLLATISPTFGGFVVQIFNPLMNLLK